MSKPRPSPPTGEFDSKPIGKDKLIFRAETSTAPFSVLQIYESSNAKRDFVALLKGHPAWWRRPYPLDTAGSSFTAFLDGDATLVDGHKGVLSEYSHLTFKRVPMMNTLQLDFQNSDGAVFRVLASSENLGLKYGSKSVVRTAASSEEIEKFRHQQAVLFRQILKTIRLTKPAPSSCTTGVGTRRSASRFNLSTLASCQIPL